MDDYEVMRKEIARLHNVCRIKDDIIETLTKKLELIGKISAELNSLICTK